MTYRLYYAPDNASLIVRLVLEEMRQPYETVLLDRARNDHRKPGYLAVNPAGKIPALETPDGVIFETGAILLWLTETHAAMAPQPGASDRADFLKHLFFTANTLHPDLTMHFYLHRYGPDAAMPDMRRRVQNRLHGHLILLDRIAAAGPPWCGAAAPSVLDYYLAACLRWCALYPAGETGWFDIAAYPALRDAMERLQSRPAVHIVQRAEGLGPTPFTAPVHAVPLKGSAT